MIAPIISDLLWQHDCVVIPGFGALVANAVPSSFDSVRHRFVPPHKKLTFNKNIKNNDGLLANALATQSGVGFQDALHTIAEEVKKWNKTLENGQSITLENIGNFYLNPTKQLVFEPAQTAHFLFESFGLESFTLLPTVATKVEPKQEQDSTAPTKIIPLQPSVAPSRNVALRYAFAGAAIAIGMLYLAWLPFNTPAFSGGPVALSDLNPFKPKPCESYKPRTSAPTAPQALDFKSELVEIENQNFGVLIIDEATQKAIPYRVDDAQPASTKSIVKEEAYNYYIVGGCFGEKQNADKYIQQLSAKGHKPFLIDFHKGLYRVALHGFSSHSAAVEALEKVKSTENKGAWLLSK